MMMMMYISEMYLRKRPERQNDVLAHSPTAHKQALIWELRPSIHGSTCAVSTAPQGLHSQAAGARSPSWDSIQAFGHLNQQVNPKVKHPPLASSLSENKEDHSFLKDVMFHFSPALFQSLFTYNTQF